MGSHFSLENPFPEPWEVIFRLKIRFPNRGKSFFARKHVSRTVGSHFSLENPFPEPWEVIFRLKKRLAKSAKSFFARKRVLQSAGSPFSFSDVPRTIPAEAARPYYGSTSS